MLQRRPHIGVVSAAVGACLIACVLIGGGSGLRGRRVVLLGAEDVNVHLRASVDSLAWACGGREVAEVCLLSTETCVAVRVFFIQQLSLALRAFLLFIFAPLPLSLSFFSTTLSVLPPLPATVCCL